MIRRLAIVGCSLALLSACGSTTEPVRPAPAAPPPPPVAARPAQVRDQCGAASLQSLVGRPRREIPVPLRPELQRVACTTCPVTMDFNANRLNFFFDAQSGLIREIRCG